MNPEQLAIDRRDWPRGADSGDVVCEYIAGIGLRPEDTYGVMPSGENAHDLLFVYRDRPEYAAARQTFQTSIAPTKTIPGLAQFGIDLEWGGGGGPGQIPPEMMGPAPPVPAEAAQMLQKFGIDLESYGVDVQQPGEPTPTAVPVEAGGIVVHSLQWPGTLFLDRWRPAASAFNYYRELTGLRPEDVYGYVPVSYDRSDGEGDVSSWSGWSLIYRDRPEYAAGRGQLSVPMGIKNHYDFAGMASYPGAPQAPLPPERPGSIRVDEQGWPRRRMVLKLKGDRMIEYLAQEIPASGVRPEDCFGLGPDKVNEHLWLAWLSDDRGPLA